MLFLLNQERVLAEVMELAKKKISGILKVDENEMRVWLDWKNGVIQPNFQVVASGVEDEKDEVTKVMADVWLNKLKPELIQRLRGLSELRYGFEEKESPTESSNEEKGQTRGT